jgi:hypothetical protein
MQNVDPQMITNREPGDLLTFRHQVTNSNRLLAVCRWLLAKKSPRNPPIRPPPSALSPPPSWGRTIPAPSPLIPRSISLLKGSRPRNDRGMTEERPNKERRKTEGRANEDRRGSEGEAKGERRGKQLQREQNV